MEYRDTWELSSIPDDIWASEHGRRQRAKAPRVTNVNLKPCVNPKCRAQLTATERRFTHCPKCGVKQRRLN